MQIVIKIPEEIYKASQIIDVKYEDVIQIPLEVIKNGTPLSKGHGRLIDERQVVMTLIYHDFLKDNVKCGDITKILDIATIIEADKEDK